MSALATAQIYQHIHDCLSAGRQPGSMLDIGRKLSLDKELVKSVVSSLRQQGEITCTRGAGQYSPLIYSIPGVVYEPPPPASPVQSLYPSRQESISEADALLMVHRHNPGRKYGVAEVLGHYSHLAMMRGKLSKPLFGVRPRPDLPLSPAPECPTCGRGFRPLADEWQCVVCERGYYIVA